MAVDKLVDSTQLNSDLTSVANAIRTKGGTSAQLAFPAGFVSAIGDISGGGVDLLQYATTIQYTWSDATTGPDHLVLNLPNVKTFTYGGASRWQPITLELNLSNDGIVTSMLGACRWGNNLSTGEKRITSIKITGDLSHATTFQNCFAEISDGNLLTIDADLDFSSATNVSGMFNRDWDLLSVRFVPNTLKVSLNMASSRALINSALVSIANGLNESVTGNTLTLHATPKALCDTIMGTVAMDGTNTYHVFTQDSGGSVSLSDFITTTKGWTLA